MTWPVFLLRLVGKSPEQLKTQEQFDKALSKLDELNSELDEVLDEIRSVDATVKSKNAALDITASSAPPAAVLVLKELETEQKEEPNERRPQVRPQLGKPTPSKA